MDLVNGLTSSLDIIYDSCHCTEKKTPTRNNSIPSIDLSKLILNYNKKTKRALVTNTITFDNDDDDDKGGYPDDTAISMLSKKS